MVKHDSGEGFQSVFVKTGRGRIRKKESGKDI